jgi:hypothetical protein
MLSHSAEETTIALKKVMRDSGTIPKVIVTDNGGEFLGEFQELLNANNIFHIKTTSYSPWGNGIVERMNRSLREKIKQGFVRHGNKKGSLEWVKYLATYCDNINNSRSTKLNVTPNMLWSPGYNPPPHNYEPNWNVDEVADHSRLKVIRENYQNNRIHLAREQLTKQPANIFDKGDWVRIALEPFDQGESRKRRKNKMETKAAKNYFLPCELGLRHKLAQFLLSGHKNHRTLQMKYIATCIVPEIAPYTVSILIDDEI